jgi:hypothetical protein
MSLTAHRCPNGHLTSPAHTRCPTCGEPQVETVELGHRTAEVVTWTRSTATPPGVRSPNPIAVVEFEVSGQSVRRVGQLTTAEDVSIGDRVRPVYVEELRDPEAGVRHPDSQAWDGYRFDPI